MKCCNDNYSSELYYYNTSHKIEFQLLFSLFNRVSELDIWCEGLGLGKGYNGGVIGVSRIFFKRGDEKN